MDVYYKKVIEGRTIPAIIHNQQYFLIDMAVYEDGSVSCWRRVALNALAETFASGWLVTGVPAGKSLSIHGLGDYPVREARWDHTPETYMEQVRALLREMNPEGVGLYAESSVMREKWERRKVLWAAMPTPFCFKGNFGYDLLEGEQTFLFRREGEEWSATTLSAYADGTILLDGMEGKTFCLEDIDRMMDSGILAAVLLEGSLLRLSHLGTLVVGRGFLFCG